VALSKSSPRCTSKAFLKANTMGQDATRLDLKLPSGQAYATSEPLLNYLTSEGHEPLSKPLYLLETLLTDW
jgi:hypothetical protein